jgi:hypothetical protein
MSKDRTSQFLTQMGKSQAREEIETPIAPPSIPERIAEATVHPMPNARKAPAAKAKPSTRAGLKHFGGYLDDDTLEKIALLRIRLKMDNSELIKYAIDEMHRKQNAKRAFGDA